MNRERERLRFNGTHNRIRSLAHVGKYLRPSELRRRAAAVHKKCVYRVKRIGAKQNFLFLFLSASHLHA